jgi:hypothetical protein
METANKILTQHLKRLTVCLVLHKDHNERLNESKLVICKKRDGSLRQPCLLRDAIKK